MQKESARSRVCAGHEVCIVHKAVMIYIGSDDQGKRQAKMHLGKINELTFHFSNRNLVVMQNSLLLAVFSKSHITKRENLTEAF